MKNPVQKFKEENDLTVADLAVLCDMSPASIWKTLNGENRRLSDPIAKTLSNEGDFDERDLRRSYQAYREKKRQELTTKT